MSGPPDTGSGLQRHPRVRLDRKASLKFKDLEGFVTELAENISLGGMFLRTTEPQPPGTLFDFELTLEDEGPLIQGIAEVVWARAHTEGPEKPAGMGVRFLELAPGGRALIYQVVDQHISRGGQPFELDRPEREEEEETDPISALLAATEPPPPPSRPPRASSYAYLASRRRSAEGSGSARSKRRSSRPLLLAATAVLVLAAAGLGWWWIAGRTPSTPGGAAPRTALQAGLTPPPTPGTQPGVEPGVRDPLAAVVPPLPAAGSSQDIEPATSGETAAGAAAGFENPSESGFGTPEGSGVGASPTEEIPPSGKPPEPQPRTPPRTAASPTASAPVQPTPQVPATDSSPNRDSGASSSGASSTRASSTGTRATRVRDIAWRRRDDSLVVTILTDAPLAPHGWDHFRMDEPPPREVLRLRGMHEPFRTEIPVNAPELLRIRTGYHQKRGGNELHVVLDLTSPQVRLTRIETDGNRLVLVLGEGGA